MFRTEERFLYTFLILSYYIFDLARKKVKDKVLLVLQTKLYSADCLQLYLFYLKTLRLSLLKQ